MSVEVGRAPVVLRVLGTGHLGALVPTHEGEGPVRHRGGRVPGGCVDLVRRQTPQYMLGEDGVDDVSRREWRENRFGLEDDCVRVLGCDAVDVLLAGPAARLVDL